MGHIERMANSGPEQPDMLTTESISYIRRTYRNLVPLASGRDRRAYSTALAVYRRDSDKAALERRLVPLGVTAGQVRRLAAGEQLATIS